MIYETFKILDAYNAFKYVVQVSEWVCKKSVSTCL